MSPPRRSDRAIVLLVVLIAMVGLCGMTVTLTGTATSMARTGAVSLQARLADELLREIEGPVQDWLLHASGRVVLDPGVQEPRLLMMDDVMNLGDLPVRIRIEAVDACGPERINLSTFPLAVIREVMESQGMGSVETIERARSEGRVPPGVPTGNAMGDGSTKRVAFITASPRWSVRVHIRVGRVERRWVAVYAAREGGWMCEERRLVDE